MGDRLVLVSGSDNFDKMIELIKAQNKKVCYVSFNRASGFVKDFLDERGIADKDFYFMDGVVRLVKKNDCKTCFYFDPSDLNSFKKAIKDASGKGHCLVIIDKLSDLLASHTIEDIIKFVKDIKVILKKKEGCIVALFDRNKEDLASSFTPLFKLYDTSMIPIGIPD